jgi:hypothetical protein
LHKFKVVPKKYWDSLGNQQAFLQHLGRYVASIIYLTGQAKELHILEPSDWYSVSYKDIIRHGGGGLLLKYGNSPYRALRYIFVPVRGLISL